MRRITIFFAFVLIVLSVAQNVSAQYPTDSVSVYLMTASPGEETYAAFGHSAIRVSDPTRRYDAVYNYGTFDFSTPNFYFKFANGRLMYFLSMSSFNDFLYNYQLSGQAIYQQKFNLTNKEKWLLVSNLENNYKPQNRFYRYSFFFDNCATRIRDIVEKSVEGKIIYDTTYRNRHETFRQLITPALGKTPWIFFGINILLGTATDHIAKLTDYMFLPGHMKDIYTHSVIRTDDSIRRLTMPPVELFPTTLTFSQPNPLTSPEAIFWYLLALVGMITMTEYRKKKYHRLFTAIVFLIPGLLSLLLLFLSFGSMHHELHQNYNLAWANPLALIISAGLVFSARTKWVKTFTLIYLVILLLFIPVSFMITQQIPAAVYPITGILILRALTLVGTERSVNQE